MGIGMKDTNYDIEGMPAKGWFSALAVHDEAHSRAVAGLHRLATLDGLSLDHTQIVAPSGDAVLGTIWTDFSKDHRSGKLADAVAGTLFSVFGAVAAAALTATLWRDGVISSTGVFIVLNLVSVTVAAMVGVSYGSLLFKLLKFGFIPAELNPRLSRAAGQALAILEDRLYHASTEGLGFKPSLTVIPMQEVSHAQVQIDGKGREILHVHSKRGVFSVGLPDSEGFDDPHAMAKAINDRIVTR